MKSPKIKIQEEGIINDQNSAFPNLVRFDNCLVCGFSRGGGDLASGDSACCISKDLGHTWSEASSILPQTRCPGTSSSLRLSKTEDDTLIAYGQRNYPAESLRFGEVQNEAVLCTSRDCGKSWTPPLILPKYQDAALEVSSPVAVLASGRWIAPCALLPDAERLAVTVTAGLSDDKGESWRHTVIFHDEDESRSFFEQKVIATGNNELLAAAWCLDRKNYRDLENHFSWSQDGGESWSNPVASGLMGQTMTPYLLDPDHILLTYNKRYGEQGIKLALVNVANREKPEIMWDCFLWKSSCHRRLGKNMDGLSELAELKFGYPSIIHLEKSSYMLVFWEKPSGGVCRIRKIVFSLNQ